MSRGDRLLALAIFFTAAGWFGFWALWSRPWPKWEVGEWFWWFLTGLVMGTINGIIVMGVLAGSRERRYWKKQTKGEAVIHDFAKYKNRRK